MTSPEVDQELERLFAVAREATQPDAGARERIRAGLAPRLAMGGGARPAWGWRAWLGVGVALLGIGAVAVGLRGSAPMPSVVVAAPSTVAAAPSVVAAPVSAPTAVTTAEAANATPPAAAPTPSVVAAAPAKVSPPSRGAAASADPAEELALVRSMQQALRSGDASQALTLAGEHARRFPRGTLVEEREGVRAIAQCQLAAPSARAQILAAFSQHFASSPYAARVKAACQ